MWETIMLACDVELLELLQLAPSHRPVLVAFNSRVLKVLIDICARMLRKPSRYKGRNQFRQPINTTQWKPSYSRAMYTQLFAE